MRKAPEIQLDEESKSQLRSLARGGKTSQRLEQRCRIVLAASEGMGDEAIAKREGVSRQKSARWRARYLGAGLAGLLKEKAGRGRPSKIKPEQKAEVVRRTLEESPEMATQWSTRRMARASGMAASSVSLIWRAHGLKPHLARGFKLSNDKRFVEKLEDVVGLYLNARWF